MTDKRRPSTARGSKSPYPTKRALAFGSPSSSTAVSLLPPRLSPVHRKRRASTDATDAARTALTFLQSARDRNVPVRYGKWSRQEDAYLEKLLTLFQDGVLANVTAKTSLRSWLAHMLNCCPMRISKKQMHGRQFEGKAKYKRQSSNVDSMTQTQYERLCTELWHARAEFLKAWAKDEYARRNAKLRRPTDATLTDWYDNVLRLVPTPVIAKRSSVVEYTDKRMPPTSLEELRQEMQMDAKRQQVEMRVEIRATTAVEPQARPRSSSSSPSPLLSTKPEPLDVLDEPCQVPALQVEPSTAVVTALPTAYCTDNSDTMTMGRYWLQDLDDRQRAAHWTADSCESQEIAHETSRDDGAHVSTAQQNAELLMSCGASRVFIDFGAPSCWYTGEEPKWSRSGNWGDLTSDDLAMSLEPHDVFGWGGSSPVASMAHGPTLPFL
uniref:Uncharacterized protein n=1 Tax=Hyaloperonospora arabidopsidis (strain Emoy2) TaxID=559515 RepID=M4BRH3_HYAAE